MAAGSTISADLSVVGTIRADEDLHVLGHVRGAVEGDHTVVVGAGALVEADVHVRKLVVEGVVIGDVQAVELLEVAATGQIKGDIRARGLRLHPGGRIAGRVQTAVDVPNVRSSGGADRGRRRTGGFASSAPATSSPAPAPARRQEPPRPSAPATSPAKGEVVETGPAPTDKRPAEVSEPAAASKP